MAFDWTTGAASLGANLGANLTQGYSQGSSSAANSAQASGYSTTDGTSAREWSAEQADTAYERQKALMQMQMEYNSREAQKAREWQESMANTVYTRSVANMREAGINPILAANMGLSAGNIGSGQSASVSGASAPMPTTIADSNSAYKSEAQGSSTSQNSSESGVITALTKMGEIFANALGSINSAVNLNLSLDGLKDTVKDFTSSGDKNGDGKKDITDSVKQETETWGNWILDQLNPFNGPLGSTIYNNHNTHVEHKNGIDFIGVPNIVKKK